MEMQTFAADVQKMVGDIRKRAKSRRGLLQLREAAPVHKGRQNQPRQQAWQNIHRFRREDQLRHHGAAGSIGIVPEGQQ
eukprot:3566889-Pyramimonas_sp.AAC.1